VFFKDGVEAEGLDVEQAIAQLEEKIPRHLRTEIEMIIIGWFNEFEERGINAFYDSGTIYVSHLQHDSEDMVEDLVHELAHSLEEAHGYEIYADEKIKKEFLRKRKHLHDLLWTRGYKAPLSTFLELDYNQEFDEFLYKQIGYDKLAALISGLFLTAYAPTSLREYFATGFATYYLDPNHEYFKKVSPALYEKIITLQDEERLDTNS
tara:strand:+ start:3494 stop:4114 length:621 start_codon:yes stop_codon:yes gene_type:complete